ncbi:hypothetical protein MmiHf6_09130 [Methanimicrococcus hongohii]|uniref:Nucleotidyl transferase AbiEii/AbiGii toxin family protein n=1 Tax=Methanimicrococcus hongohii TaxID=3028295 RepID=A0AA96UZK1_9EURY|nr:nucleotidyl transferase AbiEii/AbiGii toxin family protein [Methanimicrococcus sp. Hf6]WNY23604.1 hypothetical protein MmiHf6_09130 [Methanimicrococcus sp. Hf6]
MKFKNVQQMKAAVKNKAAELELPSDAVMQNYMMERFLERISLSNYRHNFILKGGLLISSYTGLSARTTMDIDTTVKGFPLSVESLSQIFKEICMIDADDDILFTISSLEEIRLFDHYPGIRIKLIAVYAGMKISFSVDVTTGDRITPHEINRRFHLMFEDRGIDVLSYPLETILAEKIETILSRSIANTRPRDFYDVYVLSKLQTNPVDINNLSAALKETMDFRGSSSILDNYHHILSEIRENPEMNQRWLTYQKHFVYASDIDFKEVCLFIEKLIDDLP